MALIRAIRPDLRQMTCDDIVGGVMPHAVTITGSRRTEHREPAEYGLLFDVYLRTLADQPEQARHTVLSAAGRTQRVSLVELGAPRLGVDAYHARNRWMVDRSDLVIGFPHGDNRRSGTWYTIGYGAERARPRLIVPI